MKKCYSQCWQINSDCLPQGRFDNRHTALIDESLEDETWISPKRIAGQADNQPLEALEKQN
jgi:hypothetical protein